jgi:hypothetical protein
MTYFAIGESTGGAGERRLGPFGTPDEAESAGRRETKESNGEFVFKGVVDEANNQVITDVVSVSTNAVVRNAMAANRRVARNAFDRKKFGNVWATAHIEYDDFGISLDSITHRAEGKNAKECIVNAKSMLSEYEKAVSGIKGAIAWMEQFAK